MKKILIVDDEKNIQVSLATVLEDEGYQVYFAKDGQEGIEKFSNIKPDAIFLDIWLPGMDGLEVIKRILAIDPLQIIIMISGHGSVSAAVSALKAGAYDFLEKPLSLDKVIFVLKRGLEFRQVRDENMKLKIILGQEDELAGNDEKKRLLRESTATIEFEASDPQHLRKQRTVALSNIIYGIGLHSGEKTGMVIKPLPAEQGHPLREYFQRRLHPGAHRIPQHHRLRHLDQEGRPGSPDHRASSWPCCTPSASPTWPSRSTRKCRSTTARPSISANSSRSAVSSTRPRTSPRSSSPGRC